MAPKVNGAANAVKEEKQRVARESLQMQAGAAAMTPARKSILEMAHQAVGGDRQENYGDQHTNFTNIADIWSVILREKLTSPITPQEVAMCQIGLKLARLQKTGGLHRDSIVDVAGYAECLDKVNQA